MKTLLLLFISFNLFAATNLLAPPQFGDRPATIIHAPKRIEGPMPLIISLHGHNLGGRLQNIFLPFHRLVDEMNFVIASPYGTIDSEGHRFWNDKLLELDFIHKNKGVKQPNVNDIGFITNLITTLKEMYPIDPKKIYLVGHSNGAFMSYRFACSSPLIAGIAVIAGSTNSKLEECSNNFAIAHIHGTDDKVILYNGNDKYFSVEDNLKRWVQCPKPTITQQSSLLFKIGEDTTKTCWENCTNGKDICLYTLEGGSHTPIFEPAFKKSILDFLFSN